MPYLLFLLNRDTISVIANKMLGDAYMCIVRLPTTIIPVNATRLSLAVAKGALSRGHLAGKILLQNYHTNSLQAHYYNENII